jgi:hypothetical protein
LSVWPDPQAPDERFQPGALKPLPILTPDYRDSAEALAHKDLRLTFDGNRYCVPPRYVGHKLADETISVTTNGRLRTTTNWPISGLDFIVLRF